MEITLLLDAESLWFYFLGDLKQDIQSMSFFLNSKMKNDGFLR